MKTVDELYDEYFLDYFADGSVEVCIDDIKFVLDEEKEEYTREIPIWDTWCEILEDYMSKKYKEG